MAASNPDRPDTAARDLIDLDLPALACATFAATARVTFDTAATSAERAGVLARDATYVTVGFGVLGLQRAQMLRRQVDRTLQR